MHYKHLFGPVPSRRLGLSLGIDLVPFKTCSLNCVYCECGETTEYTLDRKEYIPTKEVLNELDDYLKDSPQLDFITFSGSGEPTLHKDIGIIIEHLKKRYPQYKIALLTNSTLLFDLHLQKEIMETDLVLPSLDAVSEDVFNQINRPNQLLNSKQLIEGLIDFAQKYQGTLWVETFIIPGINDHPEELKLIKSVLEKLDPDQVQLNSIDRPGTESWVSKPPYEKMVEVKEFLAPLPVIIIGKYNKKNKIDVEIHNIESKILSVLQRRPCTKEDISKMCNLSLTESANYIKIMIENKMIEPVNKERGTFYKIIND